MPSATINPFTGNLDFTGAGATSFAGLTGKASTAQGGLNQDNSGTSTFTPAQGVFFDLVQTKTNYIEGILQNLSNAAAASTDLTLTNDLGTNTTYYANLGINSSGFTGSGSLNLANATYLTATSGELVLGTTTANGIRFVTNAGTTDAMSLSSAGVLTVSGQSVFSKSAASSSAGFWLSGDIFAGTGTTAVPQVLIAPAAYTTSTTWGTGGTMLGLKFGTNIPSAFIDCKYNNDVSVFKVDSAGAVTVGAALTAGTSVLAGSTSFLGFTARSLISSPADGNILLQNSTASTFGLLLCGGTTASFPAIKRNAAALQFRLANDSGFCAIEFGIPKFSGTNSTGAGSALLGANSPAVTLTAPYTWATVTTSDGSTGYIPIWK